MSTVLPFECDYEADCLIEPDHECACRNCELNPMFEEPGDGDE